MGWSWGGVVSTIGTLAPLLGLAPGKTGTIASAISRAVLEVESAVQTAGPAKRQRAIEITSAVVEAAEGIAGRDMLSDAAVRQATGAVIDAEVALRNAHRDLGLVVDDWRSRHPITDQADGTSAEPF